MHEFELRVIGSGIELSGGRLRGLLVFPECEPDRAFRMVGFLSQKEDSVLRIFNAEGKLVKERRFDSITATPDAVGRLKGARLERVVISLGQIREENLCRPVEARLRVVDPAWS